MDEDLQEAKIFTDKMKAKKEKSKIANSAAEQVDEMAEKVSYHSFVTLRLTTIPYLNCVSELTRLAA